MTKKKKPREEGEHEVTITITIAKASLTDVNSEDKKRPDQPAVQNYFHCAYKLLPDEKDATKADVVTFGNAAKLYGEHDAKVLRTWLEGNRTWVAWTTTRKIQVTHDVLLRMFKHKVELKVWDTRDKVSAKARFDRPKAFRLPPTKASDEIDLNAVRELLTTENSETVHLGAGLSVFSENDSKSAEASQETVGRPSEKQVGFSLPGGAGKPGSGGIGMQAGGDCLLGDESKLEVQVRLDENNQPEFGNLLALASSGKKPLACDTVEEEVDRVPAGGAGAHDTHKAHGSKRKHKKKEEGQTELSKQQEQHAQSIRHSGLACVAIPLSALFTDCTQISNDLPSAVSSIEQVVIVLTLDQPLLSAHQRSVLNPMILTIGSAMCMPNKPLPYDAMAERYEPVYAMYKFHDEEVHKSQGRPHGRNVKFLDRNVVLLGTKRTGPLFEYLRGPRFSIELHDRELKPEYQNMENGVFGSRPKDDDISSAVASGARPTEHNPFLWQNKPFHPYGTAEFDLSELLLGEKIIELISPIQDCHHTDVNGTISKGLQPSLIDRSVSKSAHKPAQYLEAGSELKIKIELAMPLVRRGETESLPPLLPTTKKSVASSTSLSLNASSLSEECPFSRIVYVFSYANKKFVKLLLTLVNTINAQALELSRFPQHVVDAALSTYKLSDAQRDSRTLDIITGFQGIDGKHNILVLEGLFKKGMSRLWNELKHPQASDDESFRTLYNSEMTFSTRVYGSLDVDLTRIRLYEPLENIVQQPLLYVRDMVPKPSFEGVSKLYQLSTCENLHNAIRNELLPEAAMLIAMSREFGVPLREEDFQIDDGNMDSSSLPDTSSPITQPGSPEVRKEANLPRTSRPWTPLQLDNPKYEALVRERNKHNASFTHDYIKENALAIESHKKNQQPKLRSISCDAAALQISSGAHNYSTQAMNSTELAKAQLRTLMEKEPNARFTYCQDYTSSTLVPVDVKALSKEKVELSKTRQKTSNGFVYPGVKTSLESNASPQKLLPPARLEELHKPWRENILHDNELKPTVDRICYSWDDREIDFDLWEKPPEHFGTTAPVTIHSAGDTLNQEQRDVQELENNTWKKKLVVDDPRLRTHRCHVATELMPKGLKSSNQLARLEDILKGTPRKHALSAPGLLLDPIPRLSVVSYPNVDTHKRETGQLKAEYTDYKQLERNSGYQPGPLPERSWSLEKNKIPLTTYKREQFGDMHPYDFRLVYRERNKLSSRPIAELTVNESSGNHLFPVAEGEGDTGQRGILVKQNQTVQHPPPLPTPVS